MEMFSRSVEQYNRKKQTANSYNLKHIDFDNRFLNVTGSLLQTMKSDSVHRSNSSLELLDPLPSEYNLSPLRREYGSHGSIDVISDRAPTNRKLENYNICKPVVQKYHLESDCDQLSSLNSGGRIGGGENSSPKLRMKLKLWGQAKPNKSQSFIPGMDEPHVQHPNTTAVATNDVDIEERTRRRAFAHYDSQSLTANLGYAAKLRGLLLARRRNTTTGASAAATFNTRSSTPDEDFGDGLTNELIDNCPFFRNEIGGEIEREVSLTRMEQNDKMKRAIHRPMFTYGVSLLECLPGETLWKHTCPFQPVANLIEHVDDGAYYYRKFFIGQDHQNWFGMDENLGPVAISIKKEKPLHQPITSDPNQKQYLYRIIVRTSELLTLRGSIFEECIPNPRGIGKAINTKDILDYVAPEIQTTCLRLAINTPQCEQQVAKLDEQGLTNKYKVGILYCRAGQSTEEDMYNNEHGGPAFNEFLATIGEKIQLKGFEKYRAGLDNKSDSTGTHSVYATYQDCEIMFHVSTMLPFTPNNRQQLLRKRHVGNDIVTIVFQEPGALPFSPKHIRSQFQHVFIIVQVVNPCSDNTHYRIAVSRSKEVPVFGPPLSSKGLYQRGKKFTSFLLAKIINAENAAHQSEKFTIMATRTRQEYLKDLCTNYCTQTAVETGQKLKIFPIKKREPTKPRFNGDASQRGAFLWQVVLQDCGQSTSIECFLGISAEGFILIEESSRQTIFATPNRSILGWSTNMNALRVYHHQGECITMNMRECGERDEQLEVIERLRAVTNGCGALELHLKRNSMGQLGFHVQPDGIVTQVETNGPAYVAGLRQGYRLVEICKVAVATLSHDQMVDLLKTSVQVTVTVIESFADFLPRRGCTFQNCKFNTLNYQYEPKPIQSRQMQQQQQPPPPSQQQQQQQQHFSQQVYHQTPGQKQNSQYMRNFSPPRSSDCSSGYGTGSSSRSFLNDEIKINPSSINQFKQQIERSKSKDFTVSQDKGFLKLQSKEMVDSLALENLMKNFKIHGEMARSSSEFSSREMNDHMDLRFNHTNNKNEALSDDYEHHKFKSTPHDSPVKKSSAPSTLKKVSAANGSNSSSLNASRNNSPRPIAEIKLRNASKNSLTSQNRSSVQYSSTFQEDLMKLISPENFSPPNDNSTEASHILQSLDQDYQKWSLGAINKHPSSMSNNLKIEESISGNKYKNSPNEEIITIARPVKIIESSGEFSKNFTPSSISHSKDGNLNEPAEQNILKSIASSLNENSEANSSSNLKFANDLPDIRTKAQVHFKILKNL
jgi:signal-induced proliferation-associated 1 like protein 1